MKRYATRAEINMAIKEAVKEELSNLIDDGRMDRTNRRAVAWARALGRLTGTASNECFDWVAPIDDTQRLMTKGEGSRVFGIDGCIVDDVAGVDIPCLVFEAKEGPALMFDRNAVMKWYLVNVALKGWTA